jgi:hypothetical protein
MLDTNVLVDALYEDLEEYSAAVHLLTLAEEDGKRSRGKLIKNQ